MSRKIPWMHGARLRILVAAMIAAATLVSAGPRGIAGTQAATVSPTAKVISGWPGGLKSYQGRYKLVSSSSAAFAKSGELTIFGRIVHGLKGLQLSGILALYTKDDTAVLYVTHFEQIGSKLSASVNSGIYTGPVIGTFHLVTRKGATVKAEFVPNQGKVVSLRFHQISSNPHP
jgi:hypothetical protein